MLLQGRLVVAADVGAPAKYAAGQTEATDRDEASPHEQGDGRTCDLGRAVARRRSAVARAVDAAAVEENEAFEPGQGRATAVAREPAA